MDIELKEKVKVYLDFLNEFKKNRKFDGKEVASLGALMSSEANEVINYDKIKEIRKYIKRKTKMYSPFRGSFSKVFSTIMNLRDDYEEVFNNTRYVYEMMASDGLDKNDKLIYAAFILSKREKEDDLKIAIEKFNFYLELTKKGKKLECLQGDYLVLAYLSLLECNENNVLRNMNIIHKSLESANIKDLKNSGLFYFTLLISEEDAYKIEGVNLTEKIEKALRIKCSILNDEIQIDSYIYSLIGLAANFVRDEDVFVREVNNIFDLLKNNKNFKKNRFTSNETFKIALNIVLERYVEYIKCDIIDIEFNEEGFIRIIEEYVMLSIGIKLP